MRPTLTTAFALFFICAKLLAQVVPKPDSEDSAKLAAAIQYLQIQENIPKAPNTIQSPNVASFGAYGEIPVSLYTGKPEILVNLHEVSDGTVKLPISLLYDAAGVRPEQHPGWVGMNFTLSTHYAVTRTVRDAPDDNKPNASTLGEHGYAFHTALLNGLDWSQNAGIIAIANTTLNQIHIDTEPDEFSFSAPGLSGKFYLGSDAKWKVQSERPVRVQLINSGTPLYPPFTPPTFTGNQWDSFNNRSDVLSKVLDAGLAGKLTVVTYDENRKPQITRLNLADQKYKDQVGKIRTAIENLKKEKKDEEINHK